MAISGAVVAWCRPDEMIWLDASAIDTVTEDTGGADALC